MSSMISDYYRAFDQYDAIRLNEGQASIDEAFLLESRNYLSPYCVPLKLEMFRGGLGLFKGGLD